MFWRLRDLETGYSPAFVNQVLAKTALQAATTVTKVQMILIVSFQCLLWAFFFRQE